jgi:hypothetical protein
MILENADFVILTDSLNPVVLIHSIGYKLKCLVAFPSITGIEGNK